MATRGKHTRSAAQSDHADRDLILVPGEHHDDAGKLHSIGNHEFVDRVIAKLPSGVLFRRDDTVVEITGEPGQRSFSVVTLERMRLLVDEHAACGAWQKTTPAGDKTPWLALKPSTNDLASLVVAEASRSSQVPVVDHFTRIPIYDRDWNLSVPGFRDKILYDEPAGLRGIEPETCPAAIRATLDDLVVDFPFALDGDIEASRQNFIAMLITAVVRAAYVGNTPLALITAPLERTGKTKLAAIVFGGVVVGRPLSTMPVVARDEELEKRITAFLLSGQTFVLLDNVNTHLDSPVLASLLTSTRYLGRRLGASETVELANTLTLLATANNPTLSGEMAKRCVPIKLQPTTDQPETRQDFRHPDLDNYVAAVRPRVVACLLGAVELWKRAGRPDGVFRMGGFEGWSRNVGGIMATLGYTDFMANFQSWVRTADPNGEDKGAFVDLWWHLFQDREMIASELARAAFDAQMYPHILPCLPERTHAAQFGREVLMKFIDQPIRAFYVRSDTSATTGVTGSNSARSTGIRTKLPPQMEPTEATEDIEERSRVCFHNMRTDDDG